jgi:hypothetical protein
MKTGVFTRSLALLLIATFVGLCDEVPGQNKAAFPKWAFCVAYEVRDADDRDARPVDPKAEKDPFGDGDTRIPYGLINDRDIVDVAALSTRIVKSGVLKHEAAEQVIRGSTQGTKRHPIMECYEPHHIFVFYDYDGRPVAAIEVCFSCNRVKMTPEVRVRGGTFGPFETADLAGLAKIATEARLDLKPFASLDVYVQRLDRLSKRITEEAEQAGAGQPATRSESDSEGGDKSQPEAEGRSR